MKSLGRIVLSHSYNSIISVDNLLEAWREFVRGKRSRKDVQEFQFNLMENILSLHADLSSRRYKHSPYLAFNISDPKPRNIHKAAVRDRLLHHAIYKNLYPFFDKTFAASSFSCRKGKGMHKAINTFRSYIYQTSQNHTRTAWVLKCDIRKFFASIDHEILLRILREYVPDEDVMWLFAEILESFHSEKKGKGLPLGNLTSQLLVNIYMNKLDQFAKHSLKAKYYVRYADDFVFVSHDRKWLENILPRVSRFLWDELRLTLHPDKVSIKTIASGIDFLGWVHFPDHRVLRTSTKRRAFQGIRKKEGDEATVQSYLGLMKHGNAYRVRQEAAERAARASGGGSFYGSEKSADL